MKSYCSIFKAERYYVHNTEVINKKKEKEKKGKRRFTTIYLNFVGKRDSKGKKTEKECSRKETGKQEAETVSRL